MKNNAEQKDKNEHNHTSDNYGEEQKNTSMLYQYVNSTNDKLPTYNDFDEENVVLEEEPITNSCNDSEDDENSDTESNTVYDEFRNEIKETLIKFSQKPKVLHSDIIALAEELFVSFLYNYENYVHNIDIFLRCFINTFGKNKQKLSKAFQQKLLDQTLIDKYFDYINDIQQKVAYQPPSTQLEADNSILVIINEDTAFKCKELFKNLIETAFKQPQNNVQDMPTIKFITIKDADTYEAIKDVIGTNKYIIVGDCTLNDKSIMDMSIDVPGREIVFPDEYDYSSGFVKKIKYDAILMPCDMFNNDHSDLNKKLSQLATDYIIDHNPAFTRIAEKLQKYNETACQQNSSKHEKFRYKKLEIGFIHELLIELEIIFTKITNKDIDSIGTENPSELGQRYIALLYKLDTNLVYKTHPLSIHNTEKMPDEYFFSIWSGGKAMCQAIQEKHSICNTKIPVINFMFRIWLYMFSDEKKEERSLLRFGEKYFAFINMLLNKEISLQPKIDTASIHNKYFGARSTIHSGTARGTHELSLYAAYLNSVTLVEKLAPKFKKAVYYFSNEKKDQDQKNDEFIIQTGTISFEYELARLRKKEFEVTFIFVDKDGVTTEITEPHKQMYIVNVMANTKNKLPMRFRCWYNMVSTPEDVLFWSMTPTRPKIRWSFFNKTCFYKFQNCTIKKIVNEKDDEMDKIAKMPGTIDNNLMTTSSKLLI